MVAATAFAVMVAAVPGDGWAKKAKPILRARIDGKKLKPAQRTVQLSSGGGTIGFLASGQKLAKLGGTIKTLLVSCAVIVEGRALPFTSTDCLTSYSETKVSKTPTFKIWSDVTLGGTQVTFEEYDGTRIGGRFSAVVPPSSGNPGLAPITVEGEFRGPFVPGDPTR
jgi:hypothetical protein